MIVGKRKSFEEIKEKLGNSKSILIVGCGECVTVCQAGGEKEVDLLAEQIEIASQVAGDEISVQKVILERQCDPEFCEKIEDLLEDVDVILTLGCGAGAQTLASLYSNISVIPGLNTRFIGAHTNDAQWDERCSACGNCTVGNYGGFCPITRCAKSLLNGPCGGSKDGHCELDQEIDCVWQLIVDRLTQRGQLEKLLVVQPPKDWQESKYGGPRRQKQGDIQL